MSDKPLVLVTGISGFLGSNVAHQLLEAGYRVRGTARQAKVSELRATAGAKYPQLEVVAVDDIAGGDLTAALVGVGAVIHVASPIAGTGSADTILNDAIQGTLNLLRQALENKVTKIVITSSWGTVLQPSFDQIYQGVTWTGKSWGKITWEEATDSNAGPFVAYLASKIFAEQEAWKFANEHPELDIATILPPFLYGPYAPSFPFHGASAGTNAYIHALITGPPGRPVPPQATPPFFCDVRDAARAHIAALEVPKVPKGQDPQDKRFLISGGSFTWKEAVRYLASSRPSLVDRLPTIAEGEGEALPGTLSTIDVTKAKEALGLTNYIGWQNTVEDTIDALLEEEKRRT